jgi:hypothetical protein
VLAFPRSAIVRLARAARFFAAYMLPTSPCECVKPVGRSREMGDHGSECSRAIACRKCEQGTPDFPRMCRATRRTLRSDCLLRLHGRPEGTFGRLSHVKDPLYGEGLGMLRMKDKPSFCDKVQLMSGTSP